MIAFCGQMWRPIGFRFAIRLYIKWCNVCFGKGGGVGESHFSNISSCSAGGSRIVAINNESMGAPAAFLRPVPNFLARRI